VTTLTDDDRIPWSDGGRMLPQCRNLAINSDYFVVSRSHDADDVDIEVIEDPRAGQRYTLLLRADDQRGLNRLPAYRWQQVPPPSEMRIVHDGPLLQHLRSNPLFWLLHEPAVLREEGYMFSGDTAWDMQSAAGRAMHALIYDIRAVECRLIGYIKQVEFQSRIYDRVDIEVTRTVPLLDFPAVFPRQTAHTVPGFHERPTIEIDRVGDLVLATNATSDSVWTWALLLDKGSHTVALLSGDEPFEQDDRFRYLWNLECPRLSDLVAAGQARPVPG
jgi:hypothetical protein